jgi:glycosyltransferase involved in cell wall biosynthesis
VGKGRGIEDIIVAISKLPGQKIECTLLGSCSDEMKAYFFKLAAENNVKTGQLRFMQPVEPGEIFKVASKHHIGLAAEPGFDENNKKALSNKIFTYLLSGLAVAATDTPAQEQFMKEYPGIGKLYQAGDAAALADIFLHYLENTNELNSTRYRALELADKNLNWEVESEKFLSVIRSSLKENKKAV